jgi:hypothetical protein
MVIPGYCRHLLIYAWLEKKNETKREENREEIGKIGRELRCHLIVVQVQDGTWRMHLTREVRISSFWNFCKTEA